MAYSDMNVTVTNFQLQNSQVVLGELVVQQIPIRTALILKGIIRTVAQAVKDMDELRQEMIKARAEVDENDQVVTDDKDGVVFKSDEDKEAFLEEVTELFNTEVKIDIPKLKPEDFGNAQMSVQQMIVLEFMIDED